jgi:P4 family phage/plasmid primase-like protien
VSDENLEFDHEAEAARMFWLIGNPVAEIRAIPRPGDKNRDLSVGLFNDGRDFGDQAVGLSSRTAPNELFAGVYMIVNRLADPFLDAATGIMGKGWGTRDNQISRIRTLFFDLDPKRDHPLGGKVCANDAEHAAALSLAREMAEHLRSIGWPEPLMMDSGNGAYLIYRVDLPNSPESVALVKAILEAFAGKFDTPAVHIDQGVYNPARVVRIAGTWNRKSDPTGDRPNRVVRILSAPESLEAVTVEQLNLFVGSNIVAAGIELGGIELGEINLEARIKPPVKSCEPEGECEPQVQAVLKYLERAQIKPASVDRTDQRFIRIALPYCPFKGPDHTDGRTAVLIWRDGTIGVKCFHEKCRNQGWSELQKALKLAFDDVAEEAATSATTGQTERGYDDPLVLAQRHLTRWADADGAYTLVHFLGDTYRFDQADGWQPVKPRELDAWVRDTIQAAFDDNAAMMSKIKGEPVKPKPVRREIVSNTLSAMESLAKRQVPVSWQSPFWLQPYEDWDANDLLCFRNGILNIGRFIEGRQPHFIPLTVKLFYEHQATFDFPAEVPPRPDEWHRFLDSLGQDEEWKNCLQEIMGYCLWLNYDLQKFFMIVGPPRSGKGTIATVIENLVGGSRAVCAPELKNFADDFGLQQAISKRIAVVPEVRMPDKGAHNVVNRLKAITGGDAVTVGRKNIPNISMRLRMKIIMLSNLFVPLPDNSGALPGRLIPLKLTKSFLGKEDTRLAAKLIPEYPGILLWALEGLRRLWQADGRFTLPKSTRDMQEQLLAASAPLQEFAEECCDLDSRRGVHTVALHRIYEAWLKQTHPGEAPLSDGDFANELRGTAPTVTKKRAKKPDERLREGCIIVETDFDAEPHTRAHLWLGICPKPSYCKA